MGPSHGWTGIGVPLYPGLSAYKPLGHRRCISSQPLHLLLSLPVLLLLPRSFLFFSPTTDTNGFSFSHAELTKRERVQHHRNSTKCLRILALGGSVTAGSGGFAGKHPDAPHSRNDSWPAYLEGKLNEGFPCSSGMQEMEAQHSVVNMGENGCSAKCMLSRYPENYETYHEGWDLVIIEPTANTLPHEMSHLEALIATFATRSQPASILLLSASFRMTFKDGLPIDQPHKYIQLPSIEAAVSSFARKSNITFVSFPRYIFSMGLYNASNRLRHCIEPTTCIFWLDPVHITKTSHRMIADFLVHAITTDHEGGNQIVEGFVQDYSTATIRLPPKLNLTLDGLSEKVKTLMPPTPVTMISFRTRPIPSPDNTTGQNSSGLVCFAGFDLHDSRGRLSARVTKDARLGNEIASFVLRLPSWSCSCKSEPFLAYSIDVEYLSSYTTSGVLDLYSWNDGQIKTNPDPASDICTEWMPRHPTDSNTSMELTRVGSFNATNNERLSVSNSYQFAVDKDSLHVGGRVHGGDFQLLSIKLYCE